METYYILTAEEKERILCTKNIDECFDFIMQNKDLKLKAMKWNTHPKVFSKTLFIRRYYQFTKETINTLKLIDLLIKGETNRLGLAYRLGIKDEYTTFMELKTKTL